ncbi:MAG: hypothetical protein JNM63_15995, partial [Spirochaetia bacterium]|nr:hypothetical protein [Spirochaetia bacterium]
MKAYCELTLVMDFENESKSESLSKENDTASATLHGELETANSGRFHRAAFHLRERMKIAAGKTVLAGLELVQAFEERGRKVKKMIREKMRIRYESGKVLACHITAD